MKRSRIDSRIEVWGEVYVNNPHIRSPKDQKAQIEQIEKVDSGYIVEVFNPEAVIERQPNIDPLKHGTWKIVSDGYANGTAHICECSLCGDTVWVYKNSERRWKYCPNCGAPMYEEEKKNDEV